MAYETNVKPVSMIANADLSASQYCFVTLNSSAKVALTGAGLSADGILQDKPAAADRAASVEPAVGRISKMKSGAAFSKGDSLSPDSTGRGVTATSGDVVGAKAMEAATDANQIVSVLTKFEVEPLS